MYVFTKFGILNGLFVIRRGCIGGNKLYYGSTSTDRYWIDPDRSRNRIDLGGVSTRLIRIRTDFWNDVGSEWNASESGPFRSVPIRYIVPMESPVTDTSIYFIVLRHYFYWQIEIYVITDITLQLKMYLYFTSL